MRVTDTHCVAEETTTNLAEINSYTSKLNMAASDSMIYSYSTHFL